MFQNYSNSLPLISIITVVLNGEATISQTIQSVINQSYVHWEYLIIDGNSTDGTVTLIQQYQSHKISWLSEPDLGIYDAMNKGIRLAQGDIIGIINSGDWYSRDALKIVSQFYQKQTQQIITGGMIRCNQNQTIKFKLIKNNNDLNQNIASGMPINHPATFVTKNVYLQLGVFNLQYKICADYDFIYRAYYSPEVQFTFTPQILAYMSLGGVSEKFSNLMLRCQEHFQIEREKTFVLTNLKRRLIWLISNILKHLIKAIISKQTLANYYALRHGI